VQRGALSATVAQYPYTMAELAVDACLAALGGEDLPREIAAPVQVVYRDNVARAKANFPRPPEPLASPFGD